MTAARNALPEAPPDSEHLTDYDRRHLKTYARLLDAAAERADWEEVARIVLGFDAGREPVRAKRAYEAHLARAQWMSRTGYRDLLGGLSKH